MRVRTSESEFLALVQKRTGWDSDVAKKMDMYCDPMIESVPKEFNSTESTTSNAKQEEEQVVGVEMYESIVNPFDMSEDLLRFMSSSLIYDPQGGSMPRLEQVLELYVCSSIALLLS